METTFPEITKSYQKDLASQMASLERICRELGVLKVTAKDPEQLAKPEIFTSISKLGSQLAVLGNKIHISSEETKKQIEDSLAKQDEISPIEDDSVDMPGFEVLGGGDEGEETAGNDHDDSGTVFTDPQLNDLKNLLKKEEVDEFEPINKEKVVIETVRVAQQTLKTGQVNQKETQAAPKLTNNKENEQPDPSRVEELYNQFKVVETQPKTPTKEGKPIATYANQENSDDKSVTMSVPQSGFEGISSFNDETAQSDFSSVFSFFEMEDLKKAFDSPEDFEQVNIDGGNWKECTSMPHLHPKIVELRKALKLKYPYEQDMLLSNLWHCKPRINKEGEVYEGQWFRGKPHGRGIWVSPEGKDCYEGEFKKGRYHGYGRSIDSTGLVLLGKWYHNEYKGVENWM